MFHKEIRNEKVIYIYIVLTSILVVASCEKPTGAEDTSGKTSAPSVGDSSEETPAPKQWHVSTLAGSTSGYHDYVAGTLAQFNSPHGIAISSDGSALYVADKGNHLIRKIDLPSRKVTTVAGSTLGYRDGIGDNAQFNSPTGIAISSDNGTLYVADAGNNRIREIDLSFKDVTTVAGNGNPWSTDGTGLNAEFNAPFGIAVSSNGTLYVADAGNQRIRKIDTSENVTTVAGGTAGYTDAVGTEAQFYIPSGIAVSSDGTLYVADTGNDRIRKIDTSKKVTTVAGSGDRGHKDAAGIDAQFSTPSAIAVSSDGSALYIADISSYRIRTIALPSGAVTTVAGSTRGYKDGIGANAQFNLPNGIAVSSDGTLYVADTENHRIVKMEFK